MHTCLSDEASGGLPSRFCKNRSAASQSQSSPKWRMPWVKKTSWLEITRKMWCSEVISAWSVTVWRRYYGRYHAVFLKHFFLPAAPITLPSVPLYLPPLVTKVNSSSSTIASPFLREAFCFLDCSYSNSVLVPKVRQKNVTVVEISEDSSEESL